MTEWFCYVTCFAKVFLLLFFFSLNYDIFIIKKLFHNTHQVSYRKSRTKSLGWDSGPRTLGPDSGVRPWGATLGWEPRLGLCGETLGWDPGVGHWGGSLGWDPGVEPWGGILRWEPRARL